MICPQCKQKIPDNAAFCPECGARQAVQNAVEGAIRPSPAEDSPQIAVECTCSAAPLAAEPPAAASDAAFITASAALPFSPPSAEPVQNGASAVAQVQSSKARSAASRQLPMSRKMKRLLFAAAGTAAMALLAIIVVLAVNSSRYCAAVNAFCDGRYAEAEEGFAALGRYLDAKDQLLFTQNTMQYLSAEELLKQRQFPEAKACFLTLGSFSDAAARAQECQNHMVYDVAAACMAQGDYEKALNGFRSLGDFLDASAQAASCENEIRYDQAEALLAQEAYAEAAELYRPLSLLAYRDAAQKLLLCDNTAAYQSAAVLLAAGENYAAYRTYQSILGFSDAEARADACVLPFPKNGAQLYSNPGYAKRRSCDFVLDNRNGETAVFVKLYRDNGDLVASMFVHPGMRGRLAVPPGMYSIHEAYGTAWFGETDLFGDKGYYIVDVFEEGLYWEFQKNYIHTLTENVKNGTAQGQRIDSGKF